MGIPSSELLPLLNCFCLQGSCCPFSSTTLNQIWNSSYLLSIISISQTIHTRLCVCVCVSLMETGSRDLYARNANNLKFNVKYFPKRSMSVWSLTLLSSLFDGAVRQ